MKTFNEFTLSLPTALKILFLHFLFILIFIPSLAGQECVIIIQGMEDGKESFASNTGDIVEEGMSHLPGGAKITRLAPSKSNKSKKKCTSYKSKKELLEEFTKALCSQECKNVILFFIGHGMGGDGIDKPPANEKDGGMWVDNKDKTKENDFISAGEIAEIIDSCKKYVKLIDNHCFGSAMSNGILDSLNNPNLVRIAISSSLWDEKSVFSDPSDKSKQYYWFMIEFLKDYYKIISDPNVMEQIKTKAEALKKEAEKKNAENETERKKIQAEIDKQNAELKKCNDKIKELEKKQKELEGEKEKYTELSNGIDEINNLKNANDQLQKDKTANDDAKKAADKEATDAANKANNEINKNKKLSQKEKKEEKQKVADDLKKKLSDNKEAHAKTDKELKEKMKENEKARNDKSKELNEKLKDLKLKTSPTDTKANDVINDIIKKKIKQLEELLAALTNEITEKANMVSEINKKIEELKKALAEIKDLSTVAPVAELIIHEAFKSAKANTTSSTAEEKVRPVADEKGIKVPDNPVKKVHIGKIEGANSISYKYLIEFYKIIDEKTKECKLVGYVINYQGAPVQPIISISCKEDCSDATFKIKNDKDGYDTIKLVKNDKGKYDGTINDKKEKTRTIASNMKSISPDQKVGQCRFINDGFGYSDLIIDNKPVAPPLNQLVTNFNNTTLEYSNVDFCFKVDFDPHGYHNITFEKKLPFDNCSKSQLTYNQANLFHYSMLDKQGVRIGELGLYHLDTEVRGSLWLEKNNETYAIHGTWDQYNGFFEAHAETEMGKYVFEKNNYYGMVSSYWHAPGYSGQQPMQINVVHLPYLTLEESMIKNNFNTLNPQLSWTQHSNDLSNYELDLIIGTRIVRTEKVSSKQKIIDLPYTSGNYVDEDVVPYREYKYAISSIIKYHLNSGIPEVHHNIYSYPIYYEWKSTSTDSTEKKFPWWIPTVAVAGTTTYLVLTKDEDSIAINKPKAIDDIATMNCGEEKILDVITNDMGIGINIKSVTGVDDKLVKITGNNIVLSKEINQPFIFSYVIQDKNGNTSSASVQVNVNLPLMNLFHIQTSIQGGEKFIGNIFSNSICVDCKVINISSSNINLFSWNENGNFEFTSPIIDKDQTYTYVFNIADKCNQTGSINLTISVKAKPCEIEITSQIKNAHCGSSDGSIKLTGIDVSLYKYLWNTGDTIYNINNLTANTYTVTLTDEKNKCTKTFSIVVDEIPEKYITNTLVEDGSCYQSGSILLTIDNPQNKQLTLTVINELGNFQFDNIGVQVDIVELIKTTGVTLPITGNHSIKIFDPLKPSRCFDSISINIPVKEVELLLVEDKYIVATGEILDGNVLSNDKGTGMKVKSYTNDSNGNLFIESNGDFDFNSNLDFEGTITYQYTVEDICGQTKTTDLIFDVVKSSCDYTANFTVTPASCDASNGAVTVVISPNEGISSYLWSNGSTQKNLKNIPAGNYTLTVFNQTLGCQQSFQIEVPEINSSYIISSEVINESCNSHADIILELVAPVSGTLDITITGPSTQQFITVPEGILNLKDYVTLSAGVWEVIINDIGAGNDCQQVFTFELLPYEPFTIELLDFTPPSSPSANDGSITINISGGQPLYTVVANPFTFSNLTAGINTLMGFPFGSFNIFAVDALGCNSNTITVTLNNIPPNYVILDLKPVNQIYKYKGRDKENIALNRVVNIQYSELIYKYKSNSIRFGYGAEIKHPNPALENRNEKMELYRVGISQDFRIMKSNLGLGYGSSLLTSNRNTTQVNNSLLFGLNKCIGQNMLVYLRMEYQIGSGYANFCQSLKIRL